VSGYQRARPIWHDVSTPDTLVRDIDLNHIDQAVYDLKRFAYNVRDFGAVGDGPTGGTDDTAAFQSTVDAAVSANKPVLVEPGYTYNIDTQVLVSADYLEWVQPVGATIRCNNSIGPAIKFVYANLTGGVAKWVIRGLRIEAGVAGHRQPLVQFGDNTGGSYFDISGIHLNARNYARDGMLLHSLYNGRIGEVEFLQMFDGVGCTYRSEINCGNIEFANWVSNSTPIQFLIQEYYGATNSLVNSLKFTNCKNAPGPGAPQSPKFHQGTVSGAHSLGATTVQLAAGNVAAGPYVASDWVVFHDSSNHIWADRIASVNSGADTITLTSTTGLPFALSGGEFVVLGRWQMAIGRLVQNVRSEVPHWERCNGIVGFGPDMVKAQMPMIGASCHRGMFAARGCRGWTLDEPSGTIAAGGVMFHQGNEINNARNKLVGANLHDLGSGGTMLQRDGGNLVTQTNKFVAGTDQLLGIWHEDTTVTASQANVQIAGPTSGVSYVRTRQAGSVVAMAAYATTPRTAGTLTATVFLNGSATTLTAVLDGTNATWVVSESSAMVLFVPGDRIDVRVTTDSAWTPTANNLAVEVWATQ
jgi:hypothetical protein